MTTAVETAEVTSVDVRTPEGKVSGSVDLPSEIFGVQVNIPLIHQVVVAQLAAAQRSARLATPSRATSTGVRPAVCGGRASARPSAV